MALRAFGGGTIGGNAAGLDAKGYGAVADGVTASHAAINAALTAATTLGPKAVVLPVGEYAISGTINVPAGVTLHANGATIKCGAAMGTGVELGSGAKLIGAKIDASATGTIRPVQIDDDATGAVIEGCEIVGKASVAASAATGAGVGVSFRPGVKNLVIRDTWIHDVEMGINCIYDVENLTLERVRISNWSGRGIRIYGTGAYFAKGVMIRDCVIDPPVGPNPIHPIIAITDGTAPVHEDISVVGCTVTGRGTAYEDDGTADQISITDTRGIRIIGNRSVLGGERGINVARRASDIVISGNEVVENDGPGIGVGDYTSGEVSHFTVSGNLCKNNGQDRDGNKAVWSLAGIRCMWATHGTVSGNTCVDNQGDPTQDYGISFGYGSSDITELGNTCHGNTLYGVYNVQGTTIGGNTNLRLSSPAPVMRTTDAAPRSNTNTMDATADDAVLKVWLDGYAVYHVEALVIYSGHTDGDMRFGFGLPTGATMVLTGDGIAGNQTSAASQTLNRASSTTFATVGAITGTDLVAKPAAIVTTGATGGWLTFRWAQGGTPQVHDTLIRAGSTLTPTRIS